MRNACHRCVLTDHGSFVLLNVYVHSTGGDTDGSRKAKKMEFLNALRAKMVRLRAAGRTVCLAGDLNIVLRVADGPWKLASVRVPSLRLGEADHPTETLGAFHQAIGRDGARALAAALERRYGLRERLRGHEVFAALGDVFAASADASAEIALLPPSEAAASSTSTTAGAPDSDGAVSKKSSGRSSAPAVPGAQVGSSSARSIPPELLRDSPAVQALRRVVLELGESCSDKDAVRDSALPSVCTGVRAPRQGRGGTHHAVGGEACGTHPGGGSAARCSSFALVGTSCHAQVAWLRSVIDEDGMVDTFSALRPHAEGRFTCWDQYKNGRYANCGRRIDYILLDKPLFESSALAGPPLVEAEDEAGARRAATSNGRWLPAPWSGSSELQEAPQPTHDSQFVPPHSGIIYTAPLASDHVAVSLLLRGGTIPPQTLELDDTTRACSFRPQRSIASFFGQKPSKSQKV